MNRRVGQPLIALLLALLLLGGLAVYGAASPSDNDNPSSRSAGKLGTLALYTWLTQLGLNVSRVSGTFDIASDNVLIEYDPSVAFSSADTAGLMAFVRNGGDVIFAFGPEAFDVVAPLLQEFSVAGATPLQAGDSTPAQPFDVAQRVHTVPDAAGYAFDDAAPFVPLLRQGGASVLGAVPFGRGLVYILGNTEPLSNDGLRDGDAAMLVLALLERAGGGSIGFDEYHHGEGATSTQGASAIFSGPIGLAALLAAALLVLFLAVNGRRLGRPLTPQDDATVPGASAYVRAMGDLFSRSRQQGPIATRYAEDLKRRTGERTGVDSHLDDETFLHMLSDAGHAQAAEVGALLRRARALAAGRPGPADLLQLAREIDALERSPAPAG